MNFEKWKYWNQYRIKYYDPNYGKKYYIQKRTIFWFWKLAECCGHQLECNGDKFYGSNKDKKTLQQELFKYFECLEKVNNHNKNINTYNSDTYKDDFPELFV